MSKTFRLPKVNKVKAEAFTRAMTLKVLEDLNTSKSLAVYLCIKYNDYNSLLELEADPFDYKNAHDFSLDYAAVNILKKADFLPLDIDRKDVAFKKFMQAEDQCRLTNDRLFSTSYCNDELSRRWSRYIFVASNKISKILGVVPSYDKFDFRFGPGASSTCKGDLATLGDKFQSHISLTRNALPIWGEAMKTLPHLVGAAYNIFIDGVCTVTAGVHLELGNELKFVPKSAKTDRSICIEPHTNILLQKGVGSYIRERLRIFGLDLTKQADINSAYARKGSLDGSYATIDLQSASDTIAYALVLNLLPFPWFELLDSLRSPYTKLPDGNWIENEKFSSMGNGFTFELETLIFYSLLLAIKEVDKIDGEVMCFGDDIIVPSHMSSATIDLLEYCGFTTNKEKTFTSGPFRESCGKDFYLGYNVRPYFIKGLIEYETDKYKVANGIRHLACRLYSHLHDYADGRLYRSWSYIVGSIPSKYRIFGPQHLGDSTIWCDRRTAYEFGACKGLSFSTRLLFELPRSIKLQSFNAAAQRAVSLYGSTENLSHRGRSGLARFKELPCPTWGWDEGAWIYYSDANFSSL